MNRPDNIEFVGCNKRIAPLVNDGPRLLIDGWCNALRLLQPTISVVLRCTFGRDGIKVSKAMVCKPLCPPKNFVSERRKSDGIRKMQRLARSISRGPIEPLPGSYILTGPVAEPIERKPRNKPAVFGHGVFLQATGKQAEVPGFSR